MQISVIIPVYNIDIEDLRRCVLSILHQTYSDFEIIIVDDGSSLPIADNINELQKLDSRIKVMHKNNEGVSAARNFGVSQSSGNYVMFADGDDCLTPWALEQGIHALEISDSDIAIGRILQTENVIHNNCQKSDDIHPIVISSQEDRVKFEQHIYLKNVDNWGRNKNGWMFNLEGCWSRLMKKSVAAEIPFMNGITIAEDTIWSVDLIRNYKCFKICLVDDLWYNYIQNDKSVLHKFSPNLGEAISRAIGILNPLYENCDEKLYNAYIQWVLSKLKQIITRGYINEECKLTYSEKKCAFGSLIKNDPWKKALVPRKCVKLVFRVKMLLYRANIMLPMFMIIKRMRGI